MTELYVQLCANAMHSTCGDLFNTEIMVHRRYESVHELRRIVASEFKWHSFDEDESREQGS